MSFGNLQKMALQMQQNMQRVEEELAAAVLEGTAGGGVVRAAVTGKQQLLRVEIDPARWIRGRRDAPGPRRRRGQRRLRAARQLSESKMAAVTGGLRLPGM